MLSLAVPPTVGSPRARRTPIALAMAIAALLAAPAAVAAPGDLDTTFGVGGKATSQIGLAQNRAADAVRQTDGKVVLVGSGTGNFDVTRLNADGSLDTAFGEDGTASYSFDGVGLLITGGNADAQSVALQPDGKIVVAGVAESKLTVVDDGYVGFGGLMRLNTDGSLDTSFSGDGKVFRGGTPSDGSFAGVAVAPGGAILAARAGEVVRYTDAGVLDNGFAGDGSVATTIDVHDLVVQGDGTALVAGTTSGDFAVTRYTAGGTPDAGFAGDGTQTVSLTQPAAANSIAVGPGGSIVLAGQNGSGAGGDFAVARLEADGDPDPTFSDDGNQVIVASGGDVFRDVAVDASARAVAVGTKGLNTAGDERLAVVRFDATGNPDATFSGDGIVEQSFGDGDDGGETITLAGTAVLAFGRTAAPAGGSATDYALARYDATGAPDATFSGDGLLTLDVGDVFDSARAVVVQPDGKIVVAADTFYGPRGEGDARFGLLRYDANGTLDPTFGSGGRVTTNFQSGDESAQDVVLQSDGKIVVAGYVGAVSARSIAIARYNANGTPDLGFSGDGRQTTAIGTLAEAHAVALDGAKIVVAGRTPVSGTSQFVVARYDAGGTLDATFSGDGYETTDMTAGSDQAYDVAVTGAGKVIAVGSAGGTDAAALARYTSGGAPDSSFSGDGKQVTQLDPGTEILRGMALTGSSIVVAGPVGGNFGVARYTDAGELDTGFSGDGYETTDFGASDDAYDVAIQSDGRILVGGFAQIGNTDDFALARYTTSGLLDSSFGTAGKVVTDFAQRGDGAFAMTIGPGDKALLAGAAADQATGEFDVAVARYLAAGGTPPSGPPTNPGGDPPTNPGGDPPAGPAADPPVVPKPPSSGDGVAPRVSAVALKSQRFRTKKAGRKKPGTQLSFKLSEAATLDVQLVRCKNKRCSKTSQAGTLVLTGKAGSNSLRFAGKVKGKALAPGAYRAKIVARDSAGNRSAAVTVKFTVVGG